MYIYMKPPEERLEAAVHLEQRRRGYPNPLTLSSVALDAQRINPRLTRDIGRYAYTRIHIFFMYIHMRKSDLRRRCTWRNKGDGYRCKGVYTYSNMYMYTHMRKSDLRRRCTWGNGGGGYRCVYV